MKTYKIFYAMVVSMLMTSIIKTEDFPSTGSRQYRHTRTPKQAKFRRQKYTNEMPAELQKKIKEFHMLWASAHRTVRPFWSLMVAVQQNPADLRAQDLASAVWSLNCIIDPRSDAKSTTEIKKARNKIWLLGKEPYQKNTLEEEFPNNIHKQEKALIQILQKYMKTKSINAL